MKVTCEIRDYSNPVKPCIRIHNAWNDGDKVEIEINDERYTVIADEMIAAIKRAKVNNFYS